MRRYYYRIYGFTLVSDYEFPQFLSADETSDPDIVVQIGHITGDIKKLADEGKRFGFREKEMWFNTGVGLFWIHDKYISFEGYNGGTIDDAAQYISGLCLSIFLWLHGMIMLHGACLRLKDKTIIVAGGSGSGKSSTSTELIKRGALLIADDVTGIKKENGQYYVYPAFPGQKLCADQVEKNGICTEGLNQVKYDLNKYEIPRNDIFYDAPSKVDHMFWIDLGQVDRVKMKDIDGADKVQAVAKAIFINWFFNEAFKPEAEDILRCIEFAKDIRIHQITRNRQKDTLNEIVNYIETQIA